MSDDQAQQRWVMEDLLDRPGNRGAAEADARFRGNASARQALDDLHDAVTGLEHVKADGGDAA